MANIGQPLPPNQFLSGSTGSGGSNTSSDSSTQTNTNTGSGNASIVWTPTGYGVLVNGVRVDKTPTLTKEQAQARVDAINLPPAPANVSSTPTTTTPAVVGGVSKTNVLTYQQRVNVESERNSNIIRATQPVLTVSDYQMQAEEATREYISRATGIPAAAVTEEMLAKTGKYAYEKRFASDISQSENAPVTISYIPDTYISTISQVPKSTVSGISKGAAGVASQPLEAPEYSASISSGKGQIIETKFIDTVAGRVPLAMGANLTSEQRQQFVEQLKPQLESSYKNVSNIAISPTGRVSFSYQLDRTELAKQYPQFYTEKGTSTAPLMTSIIEAQVRSGKVLMFTQTKEEWKPVTWFGQGVKQTEQGLAWWETSRQAAQQTYIKALGGSEPAKYATYAAFGAEFAFVEAPAKGLLAAGEAGGAGVGLFTEYSKQAIGFTLKGDFKSKFTKTPEIQEYGTIFEGQAKQLPTYVAYYAAGQVFSLAGGAAAKAGQPVIGSVIQHGGQGVLVGSIEASQVKNKEDAIPAFVGGTAGGALFSYGASTVSLRSPAKTETQRISMVDENAKQPGLKVRVVFNEPIKPSDLPGGEVRSGFGIFASGTYREPSGGLTTKNTGFGFYTPYIGLTRLLKSVPEEPVRGQIIFPKAEESFVSPGLRTQLASQTSMRSLVAPIKTQRLNIQPRGVIDYQEEETYTQKLVSFSQSGLQFRQPEMLKQHEENRLKLNIEPLVIQAQRLGMEVGQKQSQTQRQGLRLNQIVEPTTRLKEEQRLIINPNLDLGLTQRVTTRVGLTPRLSLKLRLRTPLETTTRLPEIFKKEKIPKTKEFKIPNIKRDFAYTPSFTASTFNIKGYVPKSVLSGKKTLSGVEFRPIPIVGKTIRKAFKQKRRR